MRVFGSPIYRTHSLCPQEIFRRKIMHVAAVYIFLFLLRDPSKDTIGRRTINYIRAFGIARLIKLNASFKREGITT